MKVEKHLYRLIDQLECSVSLFETSPIFEYDDEDPLVDELTREFSQQDWDQINFASYTESAEAIIECSPEAFFFLLPKLLRAVIRESALNPAADNIFADSASRLVTYSLDGRLIDKLSIDQIFSIYICISAFEIMFYENVKASWSRQLFIPLIDLEK